MEKKSTIHKESPIFVTTGGDCIEYPVGKYIENNMQIIKELINVFVSHSLFKNCNGVNLLCTGSSGAIIAAFFSEAIIKEDKHVRIAHVKKRGENSHSNSIPSLENDFINVIVDDFISSGATVNEIYNRMNDSLYYSDPLKIDALIISGMSYHNLYNFNPKYVFCGEKGEKTTNNF